MRSGSHKDEARLLYDDHITALEYNRTAADTSSTPYESRLCQDS